jgi:ferredoxin
MMITNECIACEACLPECPNSAIFNSEEIYAINPDLCTECYSFTDSPQCAEVCPVDCIIRDPIHTEIKEQSTESEKKVHINW